MDLYKSIGRHKQFFKWDDSRIIWSPKKQTVISLLILGSLWYLGSGQTFDNLEESTGVTE